MRKAIWQHVGFRSYYFARAEERELQWDCSRSPGKEHRSAVWHSIAATSFKENSISSWSFWELKTWNGGQKSSQGLQMKMQNHNCEGDGKNHKNARKILKKSWGIEWHCFFFKHSLKVRLIRKQSNNCGNIRIRREKRVQRKALLEKLKRNR